jgi:hypothetical protein
MMRKEQRFIPFFWLVKTKAKTTRERKEEAQSFHILAEKSKSYYGMIRIENKQAKTTKKQ